MLFYPQSYDIQNHPNYVDQLIQKMNRKYSFSMGGKDQSRNSDKYRIKAMESFTIIYNLKKKRQEKERIEDWLMGLLPAVIFFFSFYF